MAHNFPFDKGRIEFQLGRSLDNVWLDSHDMAKLFLPTLSSYKLMAIATHLHIPDTDHHRALNDAIVCAQVFLRILDDACTRDPFVLHEMAVTYSGQQETLFASSNYSMGDLLFRIAEKATATQSAEPLSYVDLPFPDDSLGPKLAFSSAPNPFSRRAAFSRR